MDQLLGDVVQLDRFAMLLIALIMGMWFWRKRYLSGAE